MTMCNCRCCFRASQDDIRIDGRNVLITGANAGIGKETAIDLASRGGVIYIACRDQSKGQAALEDIRQESGSNNVHLRILDLASFASIRQFCDEFLGEVDQLHILINNAGVMGCDYMRTEDGLEMQFGVNHIGHFLLTYLLLDRIKQSAPSRIVTVSSKAHTLCSGMRFDDLNAEVKYNRTYAYCQSKLANIYFTKKLHRMLLGSGVTTYTLHPGGVQTDISRHISNVLLCCCFLCMRCCLKSSQQGAQTSIYCAVEPGIENESGNYFEDCKVTSPSGVANDEAAADRLWEESLKICGF